MAKSLLSSRKSHLRRGTATLTSGARVCMLGLEVGRASTFPPGPGEPGFLSLLWGQAHPLGPTPRGAIIHSCQGCWQHTAWDLDGGIFQSAGRVLQRIILHQVHPPAGSSHEFKKQQRGQCGFALLVPAYLPKAGTPKGGSRVFPLMAWYIPPDGRYKGSHHSRGNGLRRGEGH